MASQTKHTQAPVAVAPATVPAPVPAHSSLCSGTSSVSAIPETFEAVVALFEEKREALLHTQLSRSVRPIAAEAGRLKILLDPGAPDSLPGQVASLLKQWTGIPWTVEADDAIPGDEDIYTLAERKANLEAARRKSISQHPVVAAVLEAFPKSTIEAIRPLMREIPEAAATEATPIVTRTIKQTRHDQMKNLGNMMKQVQQMQERMQEMQTELQELGGGRLQRCWYGHCSDDR